MRLGTQILAVSLTLLSAAPLLAQESSQVSMMEKLIDSSEIVPIMGIVCGMLAILIFGAAAIVRAYRGNGESTEEIIDRLHSLEDRLSHLESEIQSGRS